ncbi:MAG: ferritin-like domain-containing protein [Deltaproteobacteria bacterium]|nr:MAG: ferritin-like domain-containing protein [Deltaproteobacteria bacterium]
MSETHDLHAMDPARFREQVHSFEFWFGAVQGYLEGLEYGHRPDTSEAELSEGDRDRLITALCNYCVGETAALEGAGGLIQIAPNRAAKIFLSTQVVDEGRHLEVLVHRLGELGVADAEAEIQRRAGAPLLEFKRRLLELVRGGDWDAAIFAQNVILEAMEFSVFNAHAETADARTREVLQGIVRDERRHLGFGENELGRRVRSHPGVRQRLVGIRRELDAMVLRTFEDSMAKLGATPARRADLARSYRLAVERLGFA